MVSLVNKNLLVFNPNITHDRVPDNQLDITDGSHIRPTYNGYATGLGYYPMFFLPYNREAKLLKVIDLQDDVGKLIVTDKFIYRYFEKSAEGTILLIIPDGIKNASVAYIGTYYYILCNSQFFKYDHISNSISEIKPQGFPNQAVFICATNNRLIALSSDTVAWSAIGDGSDFKPDLGTGAGFQSLDSLSTGRGVAIAAKKNGFLVFTTTNVISATELNTELVYNFKEVSKHRLLNERCCITSTFGLVYFIDSDSNLYSYEDLGSLGSGGFKVVNEVLLDYFSRINVDVELIDLVDARYLVINYSGNIIGIDLVTNRLFKVYHKRNAVNSFYFMHQSHFWKFGYKNSYNTDFNEISYFGNQLHIESKETIGCAVINLYADLPLADAVITHLVDTLEPKFTGLKLPEPKFFYEDLLDSLINWDLNDEEAVDIDLNLYNNTVSDYFELSCAVLTDIYQQAKRINKVSAEFEFSAINFAPEIPIDCTTVITRVDTNMSSNRDSFIWDCQITKPQLDCRLTTEPQFDYNKNISYGYDVNIQLASSTDAYGQNDHHIVPIEDKYYVGQRLCGNIYNTGIYHQLKYSINGYCEITGIQFNLFKGGLIYDR